jgi:hypothetical protein
MTSMSRRRALIAFASTAAAAKFFELPVLGELDKHEIAEATHVFQQKLLARPAYRSYVDLTKRQNAG